MWIFTLDGFFSGVEHAENNDFIHIRARWREDLENLKAALRIQRMSATFDYPLHDESNALWNIMDLAIQETPAADYPYRMNVTRKEWQFYLKKAAEAIDYTNFKNAVHDRGGDADRLDRYFAVWSAMRGD